MTCDDLTVRVQVVGHTTHWTGHPEFSPAVLTSGQQSEPQLVVVAEENAHHPTGLGLRGGLHGFRPHLDDSHSCRAK